MKNTILVALESAESLYHKFGSSQLIIKIAENFN